MDIWIYKSRQILSKGVPQMSRVVFADNGLLMVASHVVPFDSVSIEVVEDSHASFVALSRVGLCSPAPSSGRPVMELVPAVGRSHFHLVRRPEPTVDQFGEELGLVASVKVAFPSRSPEELGASQEAFHPAVLCLRLKGDQVHATLPAVVPCIEPIPLGVPNLRPGIVHPAEVVVFASKLADSIQTCSLSTEDSISEAKSATSAV